MVHLGGGSVEVEVPRVREDGGDFQSGLLAPYQRTSPKVLEVVKRRNIQLIGHADLPKLARQ